MSVSGHTDPLHHQHNLTQPQGTTLVWPTILLRIASQQHSVCYLLCNVSHAVYRWFHAKIGMLVPNAMRCDAGTPTWWKGRVAKYNNLWQELQP